MVVGERPRVRRRRRRGQRWRLLRLVPLVLIAGGAFAFGAITATAPGRAERKLVTKYVTAWTHGDYSQMYTLLDPATRAQMSEAQFVDEYRMAATTATLTKVTLGTLGPKTGDAYSLPVVVHTKLFGTLREVLQVPLAGSGSGATVHFDSALLFPGLRAGEQLSRKTSLPPRATIYASDGTPLAQGPDRTSPIPDVASQIVGTLGPIPTSEAAAYRAKGYPAGAQVGMDGLERVFQDRLAGKPGGTLLAGTRVLAHTEPVPGRPVTSTINPTLERAAVAALGNSYAGIVAMDPRTGAVLAAAGIAYSDVQPPGSTMKMVTVTAALDAGIVRPSDTFPIQTSSNLDGFILQNAGGEACGGTLVNAFAVSCNSVFAPLGAKLGGPRLVKIADRFGFNHPPSIPGALESTIPPSDLTSNLETGSSAIGQGKVQATALEMADVGATIAMGGRRPVPTLLAGAPPRFVHVTSQSVANEVQQMMIAVVQYGTGTSAQIPGVVVAGKTGTAELTDTAAPGASTAANTDAWFVGYAPVPNPRVVAGALFPNQGAGGATAAPAVQSLLVAALHTIH
jgi:cell division protein FtsI/penicillin-binding protein 2